MCVSLLQLSIKSSDAGLSIEVWILAPTGNQQGGCGRGSKVTRWAVGQGSFQTLLLTHGILWESEEAWREVCLSFISPLFLLHLCSQKMTSSGRLKDGSVNNESKRDDRFFNTVVYIRSGLIQMPAQGSKKIQLADIIYWYIWMCLSNICEKHQLIYTCRSSFWSSTDQYRLHLFWKCQQTCHNLWTRSFLINLTCDVVNTTTGGCSYGPFSCTRWTQPHLKAS